MVYPRNSAGSPARQRAAVSAGTPRTCPELVGCVSGGRSPDPVGTGAEVSSRAAYRMAEVQPGDFHLVMLYDCFTVVPIIEMEDLGLVERGAGGAFVEDGHARVGGTLPINMHGGMLSHAHAGASRCLFDIIEASSQLRGTCRVRQVEGTELAVVHVEGGILSSHCTLVLSNTV
jgi:acetyl-CoA acetyltransferase